MMLKLKLNKAKCLKCLTILVSKHRHDFQVCPCGNAVDGGLDYLKRSGKPEDLEDLSEYE